MKNSEISLGKPSLLSHSAFDDVYGLSLGVMFIALGLNLLKLSGFITGGIAGMALLVSYWLPMSIGMLFMLVNIPFLIFSYFSMGKAFALKTVSVSLVLGLTTHFLPYVIHIDYLHPVFAALFGGTIIGLGILCLARHNASVGGTGALTLWMQKKYRINAGKSQMALDALVFVVALTCMDASIVALSAVSAVAMNAMLIIWHKPGRYNGGK
ncbi:YitT family protein [Vitreoscilla massiliensis]|uniref:YitT family protein n=1 Tax=Vitreoscilla massiliensis TaxID=1689272 RepID=A0ABY4E5A9_9NEIS|nr:YitT family protein [Vitreoscilla massiliensis]UOO90060.1 YitT family protein [Vitreoscilla massiliensis]